MRIMRYLLSETETDSEARNPVYRKRNREVNEA